MIDKVIPRKLDSSTDSRLRAKNSMFYAKNVEVSENYASEDSGNSGVLKPKKGNTERTQKEDLFGDLGEKRVVGSVTDTRTNVIYFFVVSSIASEHGVYAYDPNGYLGVSSVDVIEVFSSPQFNFPQNGFVKGDVVHASSFEKGMLYFTDNENEPRRLDIAKALSSSAEDLDGVTEKDFITACPKTPLHPIEFVFENDLERDYTNFESRNGFQFAYQCLYRTGEESAISTYSDIAVPPAYIEQGSLASPNIQANKVCKLRVFKRKNNVPVFSDEIEKIRILVRSGDGGSFFVVDEVPVATNADFTEYKFYNDRVITAVPSEDQQKLFDSLPKKAKAQTVIDNRLFYGNYTEGFDEPEVNAEIQVVYRNRDQDATNLEISITPICLMNGAVYNPDGSFLDFWQNSLDYTPNKKAGYKIDLSNLPNEILTGNTLEFSIKVTPDKNFHVYNTEDNHLSPGTPPMSMHLTKEKFGITDTNAGNTILNSNGNQLDAASFFGGGGLLNQEGQQLKIIEAGNDTVSTDVVVGTSATNPLIIPKGTAVFSFSVAFNSDVTQNVQETVRNIFIGIFNSDQEFIDNNADTFSVISSQTEDSYAFNLGLPGNGGTINVSDASSPDPRKNLIFGVKDLSDPVDSAGNNTYSSPKGYFILNSGEVSLSMAPQVMPNVITNEVNNVFLSLNIESLNVFSTRTCVPEFVTIPVNGYDTGDQVINNAKALTQVISSWKTYSEEYLIQTNVPNTFDDADGNIYFMTSNQYDISSFPLLIDLLDRKDTAKQVLRPTDINLDFSDCSLVDGASYFKNRNKAVSLLEIPDGEPDEVVVQYNLSSQVYSGSISSNVLFFSRVSADNLINIIYSGSGEDQLGFPQDAVDDLIYSNNHGPNITNGNTFGISYSSNSETSFDENGNIINGSFVSGTDVSASAVETPESLVFFGDVSESNKNRSFKSKAYHDFGIVYYDERGRSGVVNPIGSAYVKGYSDVERDESQKGKADMLITINNDPPDWAHHYQIVYAGNSSVSDFVQYTAGGAFVATQPDEQSEGSIYVSLNYLQNNKTASYVHGFGAMNTEGGNDIYVFKKGDRLRVISYYTANDESSRIFPNSYDFSVVDSVVLSDSPDENPLFIEGETEDSTVPEYKKGQFLVLRNNPQAQGFAYSDVNSGTSFWNNRCLVEIYTPSTSIDSEDRSYYEVSNVYNIVKDQNTEGNPLIHQTNSVLVTNGDVWWRRIALNFPQFEDNAFPNIIQNESSQPLFSPYYVESKTFTDVIPNADVNSFGKIKLVDKRSKEVVRDSSIIHSDLNNYSTSLVRFTSFNGAKLPFKDIPNEHGSITYLVNYETYILCIQEDRCSRIPINRNILSDAAGNDTLIANAEVMGIINYYANEHGCDQHPESVCKIGNNTYFVNKLNCEVVRFNPSNGLYPISESGMKSYFRRVFEDESINRIVGGNDALNDEYVLSWMFNNAITVDGVEVYNVPTEEVIDGTTLVGEGFTDTDATGGGGDGDGDTGGGGGVTDPPTGFEGVDLNDDGQADIYVPEGFTVGGIDTDGDGETDTFSVSNQPDFSIEDYITDQANELSQEQIQQAEEDAEQNAIDSFATVLAPLGIDIVTNSLFFATNSLEFAIENLQEANEAEVADLQADINTLISNIYNDLGGIFVDVLFNLTKYSGGVEQPMFTLDSLPANLRSIVGIYQENGGPSSILNVYLQQVGGAVGSYAETIQATIQGEINNLLSIINSGGNTGTVEDDAISLAFDPQSDVSLADLRTVLFNNLIRTQDGQKVIGSGDNIVTLQQNSDGIYFFEQDGITFNITAPEYRFFKLDINDDGIIGSSDLLALLGEFGGDVDFFDATQTIEQQTDE